MGLPLDGVHGRILLTSTVTNIHRSTRHGNPEVMFKLKNYLLNNLIIDIIDSRKLRKAIRLRDLKRETTATVPRRFDTSRLDKQAVCDSF